MMTTAMDEQQKASGERREQVRQFPATTVPVDAGLLVTLNSRMHCRMPMQLVDHGELPVRQPVYVDGSAVVELRPDLADTITTYRCACGFTIDDPGPALAAGGQALAS